jgi:MerR family mercuric resistance operon transcriptional regulator
MSSITDSRAHTLTIGALSRQTGVNVETIRYYERIGLVSPPPRSGAGRRCYANKDTEIVSFIRRGRELGFSLNAIRTLLSLSSGSADSCAQARALAADHLSDVRGKLHDLSKLEKILADSIHQCDTRCCGDRAPVCPVIEALHT